MLAALRVRNVGAFDEATVDFDHGFTVLTGETGAGKTLLVEALHLVLGGSDRSLPVRDAEAPSLVEATFLVGDEEVVAGRERSGGGRLRALLDGVTTSAKLLSERVAPLCELHGQHEHQVLRRPGAARSILDRAGSIDDAEVRRLRRHQRELLELRDRLGGTGDARARRVALLEHELAEIDVVAPEGPRELDELVEEAIVLTSLVDARDSIVRALVKLDSDGDGASASELVASALGELPRTLEGPRLEIAAVLERLRAVAGELRRDVDQVGEDPHRLDELNSRITKLQDLVRKHGRSLADVLARRGELQKELAELHGDDERAAGVENELATATSALGIEERSLLEARRSAAEALASRVQGRLEALALAHARFQVRVEGSAGEDVTFLFAGSAGFEPAPLADAASGGELSRVMLAVSLATRVDGACMVFDEVDAGVGGATALALAACLRELASHCQVVVVTHLATVAAVADHQIVVTADAAGRASRAVVVTGDERVRELARMLGGDPSHPDALAHARSLLARDPATT
jgi:DNA repair protein RecN (Recombination protein N)